MRTGVVQADLRELLDEAPAYLPELMAAKAEAEHGALEGPSIEALTADVEALRAALDEAEAMSRVPESAAAEAGLHELLVRARLTR